MLSKEKWMFRYDISDDVYNDLNWFKMSNNIKGCLKRLHHIRISTPQLP